MSDGYLPIQSYELILVIKYWKLTSLDFFLETFLDVEIVESKIPLVQAF